MEIAELPREGLLRRFRVALPPAPIAEECARRLSELTTGLDRTGAMEQAQRETMLTRSEAAIHADILGHAIEVAVARILRDNAIRPAARPSITIEPRGGAGAHVVAISVEALPEVTVPDLGAVVLERLHSQPGAEEVDEAVEALRRRHGTWHALTDGAAEPGDEITADISAWIAANLLRNPGAQAVGEHAGGLPRHWDLRTDGALTASVAGHGAGFVDIRCKGSVGADTRVVLAFESPEGVPAAPGQRFAFMVELRQVAGTLPGDVVFALALEECAPGRVLHAHTGQVSPGLACFAAQTGADAALTHVRPAFHVGGAVREGVDFTIRVASPCLLSPAVLPATPHPAMRAEGFAWRLGEDGVMPGLDAGLVGMRPGATRRVSVTAPLRGAGLPAELAGRELVVDCRVQALRRLALPALDDEFATRAGQRDLAALRAAVGEELRAHCEASSARLLRLALLEHLAAMPAMLPRGLVDNESRLLAQRTPSGDAAALRSIAEQRLRLRMVLRKLGEGFGLAIAATDLEAALAQEAARFPGQEAEALAFLRRNAAAAQRVADQLWTQRVIDHALSLVEVRDRAVAPAVLREAAAALDARDAGLDD